MAKQPTDATTSGSTGAGGADVAQNMRQAAESTLSQAKQAMDRYMREATRMYGAMESSVEAAQTGARDINRKAFDFREAFDFEETNVKATLDFAQQLVRAKDPKEIVQLQQDFLKRQVEQMNGQMRELGQQATQTAQAASAAARPKT
jgi:hypothetical protein